MAKTKAKGNGSNKGKTYSLRTDGITQSDIARAVGVNRAMIVYWIRSNQIPAPSLQLKEGGKCYYPPEVAATVIKTLKKRSPAVEI